MLSLNYDFEGCVRNSEKIAWTLDKVIPAGSRLDFKRPFLPDALTGAAAVGCLNPNEKLVLNQINGNAYINLFAFVEEYIIAMAVGHAHAEIHGDSHALRALTRFADEEVKHQEMFKRALATFAEGFPHQCGVLDGAQAVAGFILGKSKLGVLLVTLHLEIMTQAHYTETVANDARIDPLFTAMLKHHWMEESQHAKIDALQLSRLAAKASPADVQAMFDDYLGLIDAFDGLLAKQAELDVASLAGALGRTFTAAETAEIQAAQHAGYRRTFLTYGMNHRTFKEYAVELSSDGAARIAAKAAALAA